MRLNNWLKSRSTDDKRVIKNIIFLGLQQGANYILPLITLPYLVRVLGPEKFGLLSFATATILYFTILTDYGFNLSATRNISINRTDESVKNEIFSSVLIIKFFLTLISFLLLFFLLSSVEKFHQNQMVYFVTFGIVIGQAIYPVWYFQGMESLQNVTILNIGVKFIFSLLVFVLVKNPDDFIIVPILTSLGSIVFGLLSLWVLFRKFSVKFRLQKLSVLKKHLLDGWHVFFSNIAISFYTISTTFILGFFANNTIVGYYSAADKILQAVKSIYSPISQSIYPLISKKLHENTILGIAFVKRIIQKVGIFMLLISLLLFFFSKPIVYFLLGDKFHESVILLKVMSILPLLVSLSNLYGIQTMLNLGFQKMFSKIIFIAALLGIILSLALVPIYKGLGTSIVIVLVELFVTLSMYYFLKISKRVL